MLYTGESHSYLDHTFLPHHTLLLVQHLTLSSGGSSAKLQVFLVASTCLLYLVAAGLFSRGVWLIEQQQWNKVVGGDAAELGDGPGSYDIDRSIWHVNVSRPSHYLHSIHIPD